jgi:hypothetical protein
MLPGGTNAAENGADVRFGPDTPVRWREVVWQDYEWLLLCCQSCCETVVHPSSESAGSKTAGGGRVLLGVSWYVVVCHVDCVCVVVLFGELV